MDAQDDAKAGVKSIALLLKKNGKFFLVPSETVVVVSLSLFEYAAENDRPYFSICVLSSAISLFVRIWVVDLGVPRDCTNWFMTECRSTGMLMVGGIACKYFTRCFLRLT